MYTLIGGKYSETMNIASGHNLLGILPVLLNMANNRAIYNANELYLLSLSS